MEPLERALLRTRQIVIRQAAPCDGHGQRHTVSPLLRPRAPSGPTEVEEFLLDDDGPLTVTQAIFNLANIIVGAGVLSVPYAFKQSGYFTAVIILFVIYITDTTGKWIGSALALAGQTEAAKAVPQSARNFAFLAEAAFGKRGRKFINFVTILEVWFACVTFMIMNGGNAKILLPSVSSVISIFLMGALATVFCLVPENIFAYLSLISSLSLLVAAVAMVMATWMLTAWAQPSAQIGNASLIHVQNIPQSVGIIMFCFAGHPVFPSVFTSMKEPGRWDFSIDISFLLAFIFYGTLGMLGYIVFGGGLDPTLTQNLTGIHGKVAFVCQDIAALGFLVKVQLTAPLLLNALLVALRPPAIGEPMWSSERLVLLAALGGVTIFAAVLCRDEVAAMAGLAGSFCVMTTSVLFPAAVHLRLSHPAGKPGRPEASACLTYAGIMLFGLVMAVLGTISAAADLLA